MVRGCTSRAHRAIIWRSDLRRDNCHVNEISHLLAILHISVKGRDNNMIHSRELTSG